MSPLAMAPTATSVTFRVAPTQAGLMTQGESPQHKQG
jgi:hypothetical protein